MNKFIKDIQDTGSHCGQVLFLDTLKVGFFSKEEQLTEAMEDKVILTSDDKPTFEFINQ